MRASVTLLQKRVLLYAYKYVFEFKSVWIQIRWLGAAGNLQIIIVDSLFFCFLLSAMPESRLQKLRKESERYSTDIKEKETDNNVFRKQIREIKSTIHQTQRDYHATAKGTSKAENQRIKMQKLLKRQKLANEVNAQEKEIAELRLELKRLSKKTFPQFDDTLWCLFWFEHRSYKLWTLLQIKTFQSKWISTSFYSFSNLPKRSVLF